jgi:putative heme-binding domain-containing protein
LIRIGDAKGVQAALPGLAGTAREDAVLVLRELKLLSLRGSGPADEASLVPEPALPEPPEPAQLEALAELLAGLPRGDAVHGRAVYRSETFACAKCHGVDAEGLAGPALSGIGRIRQPRDLLESIALPSASFVRGYASYEVVTDTGSQAGVIVGLNEASLTLVNAAAETLEIPRAAIREVKALSVSIMPPGFHRAMPQQHLADLLAYLMSLQQAP